MKDIRKWRFRFVVIVLVAGGFFCWMALQQTGPAVAAQKVQIVKPGLQKLPASAKEPPDMVELKDTKAVPTKSLKQSTREDLLQKVLKQPGGKEKIQRAKAKQQDTTVLRSSSKEPPGIAEVKDTKAVPMKSLKQSTRDELLQKVLKQPGGKEKIQRANPRGFKPGARSDVTGLSLSSLTALNPFQAGIAHASNGTMYLSPGSPYRTTPFYAYISTIGELGGYSNTRSGRARLYNYTLSSQIGTRVYKPSVQLRFNAVSTGWYLINFMTYPYGAKATLKHWNGSTYTTVQIWDERSQHSTYSYVDHPAMINLSAGYHTFYWIVEPGTRSDAYLYYVSIEKI